MSFEIEIKYRDVDHARLLARLLEFGAVPTSEEEQEDHYLNHPARDFAVSQEALRIRRIGNQNRITYKGPKRAGPTKTREEIEIGFTEGQETFEELSKLFENLGFRTVAAVHKRRHSYRVVHDERAIEVTLDHVNGLGDFAEIEIIASGESEIPAAQRAILGLAEILGLGNAEPRSYLRMVLEQGPNSGGSSRQSG